MQPIVEFRSELEDSLTWRITEYIALKNLIKDNKNVSVVKSLVVMLYAHFEGFFKDCMEIYIKYVNSSARLLKDFNDSIIAASLSREFSSFEDMNRKCKELTSPPPSEDYLHKFHRRKELTITFNSNYLHKQIRIKENVINTKSNLSYDVFQANMFILGLDYNKFDSEKTNINRLVNLRNSIAHGSQKDPIEFHELEELEKNILLLMEDMIKYLYQYCYDNKYLKIS